MSLLASLKLLAIQKQALPALRVDPGIIQGSIMGPSGPSAIFALEDLEDQLRVYRVSALVYRCASIWAEETIQIPLRIFRWGPSGRLGPEVLDGPVWQLLDSINGLQAWPEFLYLTMLNLALTGNAFWWKVRNRRGVVVELWSLKPTEIKIERMPGSAELRYEWRPSDMGSVAYVFDQSSIVHLRIPSPLSDVWGMSPVRPAADDIRADQQAKRSTLGMLDNSALPAGVLVSSQDLSDEQAGMIRRQWREVYGGPANVGRIAVLGRGAEFKTIAVQPKDIEYLNQRKLSRAGIINAFGIPPIYVGIESENFGNRREQRRQLWQDKLVPLFRLIEGQITERLLRDFDASYVAVLDEMRTDIFVGIIGEQIETATKAVNGRLMTPNESRRTFLAPFLRDVQGDLDGGDEFLVPMSMVPASRVFSGETMDFFGSTQVPRTDPAVKAIAGAPALLGLTEGDAHRIEAWKRFESIELPATRGLWKALMTLFDGLAREIVSSLGLQDDAEPSEGMLERVVPAPGQVKALLSRVLDPHLRSAFQAGYKRGAGEIPGVVTKADDDLEDLLDQVVTLKIPALFDPLIGTFLQARLVAYGPLIAESIVTAFRASLLEGLQAGETITMLQNRLMAFSDLSSPMRALRVARTEIVNAANAGALASYRDSGVVEQQEWVTARDAFVRPAGRRGGPVFDHVAADGQVRALDEPFLVSGESLMYPGDASMGASAGNIVNCFLPGTLVSGQFIAGSKSRYSGPAREITSARGYRLRVTPNHPILTPNGWRQAKDLNQGDQLFSDTREIRNGTSPETHKDNAPALIEDVFLSLSFQRTPRLVTTTGLEFHGDAIWMNGQIEIVGADRPLLSNLKAMSPEESGEFVLMGTPSKHEPVRALGSLNLHREADLASPYGIPRSGTLPLNTTPILSEFDPFQPLRVGLASQWDFSLFQSPLNDTSANLEIFGELIDADPRDIPCYDEIGVQRQASSFKRNASEAKGSVQRVCTTPEFVSELFQRTSGVIALDEIIEIRDFYFSGHVYDLQTNVGWMIAQNIVACNCRCSTLPIVTS